MQHRLGPSSGASGEVGAVTREMIVNDTEYVLSLLQLEASGKTFQLKDPGGGLDLLRVERNSAGRPVVSSNRQTASLPDESFWLIADQPSIVTAITLDVVTSSTGTGKDHGALRGVADQRDAGGSNLMRALEGRAIRIAPAAINGTWGMELNVTSTVPGSHPTHLVGAYIAAGTDGSHARGDSALWIGGPAGWKSAIDYYNTDNTERLFRVDQNGSVYARPGTAGLPGYTFTTSTFDGMYSIGSGSLGLAANGVFQLAVSDAALQVQQPILAKQAALGIAAPAGYSYLAPNADGFVYRRGATGAAVKLLDASQAQTLEVGGVTASPTTAAATYADLADMTLTFTNCVAGDLLDVLFYGAFRHSAAGAATVVALQHNANPETRAFSINNHTTAGATIMIMTGGIFTATAGTNVVKVRWLTGAPTATANGTDRYMKGRRSSV